MGMVFQQAVASCTISLFRTGCSEDLDLVERASCLLGQQKATAGKDSSDFPAVQGSAVSSAECSVLRSIGLLAVIWLLISELVGLGSFTCLHVGHMVRL